MHMHWLTLSCLLAPAPAGDRPPPTGDKIVAGDAKLELLFTRTLPLKGGLTEGPAVAPDGCVYFSDIPMTKGKGVIMRFDPKTKKTTVFQEDSRKSNGLKFDAKGRLVACEGADGGGRCVSRYDIATGKREVLVDNWMGKKFNACNDLCIDTKGRIYFSDPRYIGPEPRELDFKGVFRLDPDGKLHLITKEVETPNGVVLSPDQKTLYLVDHNPGTDKIDVDKPAKVGAMKIYAFPLGEDGKVSGPRKTLWDFGTENGADGLAVDVHGNVYAAARALKRPGVLVLSPEGKEVAFIPTGPPDQGKAKEPRGIPSNVAFGVGADRNLLYVTVDTSLYRVRLKVDGYRLPQQS
jgi:gluconolactonase